MAEPGFGLVPGRRGLRAMVSAPIGFCGVLGLNIAAAVLLLFIFWGGLGTPYMGRC